jgi:hypothetical protein
MAGLVQRREGVVEARVAVEDQGDEHAVPAVDRRAAERLVHDGHDALAVLAEGFGQELLDPWAEGADRLGRHQGDLVPARPREPGQRRAQPHRGIVSDGAAVTAALDHGLAPLDQGP